MKPGLLLFLTGIGIVIAWYVKRGGYRGDGFDEYESWKFVCC